ncbi:adenylate/guanylate cyclase domain-containing protein [Leptospira paudalimensis]|uniref:Adenylate/guanylate cyclase domain-containing protein n=1 Tax=Leptospira paudalimensis TaxID=2950024 RepID=A0ABT3M4E6_9LEPT|nr:adenylate/guanylate cyclase domain-containing protein [Leptospira paudalimensis]MCW7503272.1 adenylate/guanylate cyclase domain-containing protein [Leptospira paudalimensis]
MEYTYQLPNIESIGDTWTYFWLQLPYGIPGIISLVVGFFLSAFSFRRIFHTSGEDRILSLNVAISFFGYGILGLVLSLRAWIMDRELLLALNNWLYLFILLILPSNFYICYALSRKKVFLYYTYLCWISVIFGYVGLFQGLGFHNEWFDYQFGKYPKATNFIKPFGIIPLVGYFVLVLPFFTFQWKILLKRIHKSLFIGYNVLFLMTISNAPVLLGYNVYPGSFFIFIPLILIAYGIFRSDFLDVNELLFDRNGLFYILFGVVSFSLIVLSGTVALGLSHSAYLNDNWFPHALPPTISFFVAIFMAIIVAGSNPQAKINQLCAFSLIITAFYNLQSIPTKLELNYLILLRISQVSFLIFSLAPSILSRFVLKAIGSERPKSLLVVDLLSILCSFLSITPYLHNGYYHYDYGIIHKSSLVPYLLGVAGFLAFIIVGREIRKRWNILPKESKVALGSVLLSGVFLLTAFFPSHGFVIPPISDYLFIPTTLLGFAVLKLGAFSLPGRTIRFSQKLANLGIFSILFASLLQMPKFLEKLAFGESLFHITLVTLPLVLFNYLLVYVFARPLAEELDRSYILLEQAKKEAELAGEESEKLLLNILPKSVAEEIKINGYCEPKSYDEATILFTDFRGFTEVAKNMESNELITELDACFTQFDEIISRNQLEKLKTIGDSYMCAGGLPDSNYTNPIDACLAALEIRSFMDQMKEIKTQLNLPYWELRIGIHTGSVIAGVVGRFKFAYDIWGSSVNTASRMESSGIVGEINISQSTYDKVRFLFQCEHRGKIVDKNGERRDMYLLKHIKPKFSKDGLVPNELFWSIYQKIKQGSKIVLKSKLETERIT